MGYTVAVDTQGATDGEVHWGCCEREMFTVTVDIQGATDGEVHWGCCERVRVAQQTVRSTGSASSEQECERLAWAQHTMWLAGELRKQLMYARTYPSAVHAGVKSDRFGLFSNGCAPEARGYAFFHPGQELRKRNAVSKSLPPRDCTFMKARQKCFESAGKAL
eukprot:1156410-Pelagomonas_calceolata.AAC.5